MLPDYPVVIVLIIAVVVYYLLLINYCRNQIQNGIRAQPDAGPRPATGNSSHAPPPATGDILAWTAQAKILYNGRPVTINLKKFD